MATRITKPKPHVDSEGNIINMSDGWQMAVNPHASDTDDDEPEESPADRVAEMLRGSFGAERASVKLYKVENGSEVFCTEYPPQEFETIGLDGVRQQWGAGKFNVRLYATDPRTNKFVRRGSQTITIAKPLINEVVNQAPQQNNELARVFESIQKNQEMMLRALTERPPAPDSSAEMMKMLTMMKMMREAMGIDTAPPQKSSIGEIVEAIKELKSAKSLIDNDEPKEESLTSMLPSVLEVIKQGIGQNNSPPQAPMPAVMLPPSIASEPQPQSESDSMILKLLADKKAIEKLIAENKTPDDAAEWIYENASDYLIAIVSEANWYDALLSVMPDAAKHKDWLHAVRGKIIVFMNEDMEESIPSVAKPE